MHDRDLRAACFVCKHGVLLKRLLSCTVYALLCTTIVEDVQTIDDGKLIRLT